MDYLLGLSDVDRHPHTAYSDSGLSDKTIDLLKEPKFNIRLLNDLIEHEHFADFMADMEIYIDGLATMQITTLNSVAKLSKDEITGEYAPNDKEYFMRTLQSAQIKEDRYFHSAIHEDIDRIVDDLRILHQENKKDTQVVSYSYLVSMTFASVPCKLSPQYAHISRMSSMVTSGSRVIF